MLTCLPPRVGVSSDLSKVNPFGPKAWIDARDRLLDELNDRNAAGSRTGDMVLLMNTVTGTIMVNESDRLPGWHGGPTRIESEVPMIWHFKGGRGEDDDLLGIVSRATQEAKANDPGPNGEPRSKHFKQILLRTLQEVRNNVFGENP